MEKTWDQLTEFQPAVLKMLENSYVKKRVAHAYIFEGSRGLGKKDVSILFAKSFFCVEQAAFKPCNHCINCRRIASKNHPDVHQIAPDGQSIKKWQIQALQEEFSKTGVESNRKIYIIEHADKMTNNAANSLLKFLEEPNKGTVAILLTERIHHLLNTILSRCQVLSFKPLTPKVLKEQLIGQGVDEENAALIAQLTSNIEEGQRLAEDSWFGQSCTIVIQLYEMLQTRPFEAFILIQNQWLSHFKEKDQLDQGLDILLLLYKDLLYIQIGEKESVIFKNKADLLKQHALQKTTRAVSDQIAAILEAKRRLNTNMNPHFLMEQLVFNLQEGSKFV